jgi:hypothetical protein
MGMNQNRNNNKVLSEREEFAEIARKAFLDGHIKSE